MELEELCKLRNMNELDLLKEIAKMADSAKNKKIAENVLRGNKSAGVELRKILTDIKFIVMVSRERIQDRKGTKKGNYLERHIAKEQKKREEEDKVIL